jgi:adenylosuccinate lyase
MILDGLSGVAQSAAKMAGDLRLLQHEGELLEPFETEQIGSSAMAYKRNPMRAELEGAMDPMRFVGRAPQQVDEFLEEVVEPLLAGAGTDVPTLEEVRV